jgi:glycosyltransferase involved in cell wall biosynthesis
VATTVSTPRANALTEKWIALLGRRDEAADGVEDYCTFLGEALERRGVQLLKQRVDWSGRGWPQALWQLWHASADRRGEWFLLQYTALGWSRRGFPFGAVAAIKILRRRGARCAVVFHESFGIGGPRWIDRVREACQNWVVHTLHRVAEKVVVTKPVEAISWLERGDKKATFVPIGANIPARVRRENSSTAFNEKRKTVAVFCLSDPPNQLRELDDISHALRMAAMNGAKPRVVFLGRGTAEARGEIERAFAQAPVEVTNLGHCSAEEVARALGEADVMLCVRGELLPSRGSAIAGIACGLPIVGYGNIASSFPLSEAGVQLVPYGNREALGAALAQVVSDTGLCERLRAKSCAAQEKYFSWDLIAGKIVQALDETRAEK